VPGGFQAPRQLADHALRADGQTVALHDLKGCELHAVAGLARPEAFFEMLRQKGLTLSRTTALPDHHDYRDWPASDARTTWLCTEKDAAKLWAHEPRALAVPLHIAPEPAFWQALDALVQKHLHG
jgi:tetraacyldisaccharide 4'-kinase